MFPNVAPKDGVTLSIVEDLNPTNDVAFDARDAPGTVTTFPEESRLKAVGGNFNLISPTVLLQSSKSFQYCYSVKRRDYGISVQFSWSPMSSDFAINHQRMVAPCQVSTPSQARAWLGVV
jgi:hypothetical protein